MTNRRLDALMASPEPYLTDGGLETTLIFHEGLDLPAFAAFPLLERAEGRALLERYYRGYFDIAARADRGFVLDLPLWRANADWGHELGYDAAALRSICQTATEVARRWRADWETPESPIVLNGVVGPRGDGYHAGEAMAVSDAEAYHAPQIAAMAGVDMVSAITLTYAAEATGVARAALALGLPVVISFTVETDGRLPSGQPLGEAIAEVDAETGGAVLYYMINCAHPDHFSSAVAGTDAWRGRIGGLRSNASRMSHAELDEAETLDAGDPVEFGTLHSDLAGQLPRLRVLGGCCGTDTRHVACLAAA